MHLYLWKTFLSQPAAAISPPKRFTNVGRTTYRKLPSTSTISAYCCHKNTNTHSHTHRHTQIDSHTDTHTDTHRHTQTDTHTDTDKQTHIQTSTLSLPFILLCSKLLTMLSRCELNRDARWKFWQDYHISALSFLKVRQIYQTSLKSNEQKRRLLISGVEKMKRHLECD